MNREPNQVETPERQAFNIFSQKIESVVSDYVGGGGNDGTPRANRVLNVLDGLSNKIRNDLKQVISRN